MRNRVFGLAAILLALTGLPAPARPQDAAPSEAKMAKGTGRTHDIEGVWSGQMSRVRGSNVNKDAAPMLPWAEKQYEANTAELKKGGPLTTDPTFRCSPPGVPRVYMTGSHPFEIVQTPSRIFLFYESFNIWRTVWMDGRPLPKDLAEPLWLGYSVGHWDADDLVVDTVGLNDKTWLDPAGSPHSDALHVTERFHRVSHNNMQIVITIDDPKAYAHSWTMQGSFKLEPWEIGEAFCVPADGEQFQKEILDPTGKP